jgi:hypothetical protein
LADFGNAKLPAGNLVVGARWVGRAFLVLQVGVTAFESWRATEDHSTAYRLSYVAIKTTTTAAIAWAGAGAGATYAGAACSPGGLLAIACGFVGGIAGGVGAYILADTVTDLVWEYSYERLAG